MPNIAHAKFYKIQVCIQEGIPCCSGRMSELEGTLQITQEEIGSVSFRKLSEVIQGGASTRTQVW